MSRAQRQLDHDSLAFETEGQAGEGWFGLHIETADDGVQMGQNNLSSVHKETCTHASVHLCEALSLQDTRLDNQGPERIIDAASQSNVPLDRTRTHTHLDGN